MRTLDSHQSVSAGKPILCIYIITVLIGSALLCQALTGGVILRTLFLFVLYAGLVV